DKRTSEEVQRGVIGSQQGGIQLGTNSAFSRLELDGLEVLQNFVDDNEVISNASSLTCEGNRVGASAPVDGVCGLDSIVNVNRIVAITGINRHTNSLGGAVGDA